MKNFEHWKTQQILSFFGIKRATLTKAEREGRIPQAVRQKNSKPIMWAESDIPDIGKAYGFLPRPDNFEPKIFVVYTAKGGVLKTTTCKVP